MSHAAEPRRRLESIDVLRGVIMIVMALDHTRDYFGHPGDNPTDLATASAGHASRAVRRRRLRPRVPVVPGAAPQSHRRGRLVAQRARRHGVCRYQVGDRRGLYFGTYAGYLQSRHKRDGEMTTADRDNVTLLPCVGYQWFPFHDGALRGAYLQPWVGATIWFPAGGTSTIGTHTFKDPYVIPIAAAHIGSEC